VTAPSRVDVAVDLLRRYDRPGPRYTSYPTAVEFDDRFTEADYRARLARADEAGQEPLSLYVHLPFCAERCTFCGCNVVITRKRGVSVAYLDVLAREIDLVAEALPRRRRVAQLHWGGGTPTYQTVEEMWALHRALKRRFTLEPGAEVAIEVDPRVTSRPQMEALREMGFNRISMGVQDFSPEVQEAVNRRQTEAQTRALHDLCRELGFTSVNMDLIYGLPRQTPESFAAGIERLLTMRPDRVAVYSFALVPWIKAQQKTIDPAQLPPPEIKLRLFCLARERFLDAGYVQIGMDHFALPQDELARAVPDRRLRRNFMGYTVTMGSDLIGLGLSAIGDVAGSYSQNTKKLTTYAEAVDSGRLPVERGYVLDADDRIRREVISRLMCHFYLDRGEIEEQFGIDFGRYFAPELAELSGAEGPAGHGFVEVRPDSVAVTSLGRLFVRNVCMVFDRHLRGRQLDKPVFSRTI
jgi:oxygen-independent coproporphyrinogen-3 oxidase